MRDTSRRLLSTDSSFLSHRLTLFDSPDKNNLSHYHMPKVTNPVLTATLSPSPSAEAPIA